MDDFDLGGPSEQDDEADVASTSDGELLKRAWRDEKAAPEILPYQEELLERVKEQVEFQEELIQDSQSDPNLETIVTLYKLDVDRIKFLMRSYLRTRLEKIEKHAIHIAGGDSVKRLSPKELNYLEKFCDMLDQYMDRAVLSELPATYNKLLHQYESEGKEPDMVPRPDLDTFVFARAKEHLGLIELDERGDENPVTITEGELFIIRYRLIRGFLENGQVELV
ncbi:hypothetical protein KFL_002480040 [Klebsormidium nitens]|uniref:DNA replication complex GINS protein SLD5 n=1 Tax=Klebsormidium nitens TaxID=105231 RepID=A0A1Y1IAE0_KLENI|nr:hypothetical protein KFL_002480040 [Klebsormidium nitens]|eukprot:GAQ85666.1 hypothetical protein KFL_002480040 [Klebsormidium nitens]